MQKYNNIYSLDRHKNLVELAYFFLLGRIKYNLFFIIFNFLSQMFGDFYFIVFKTFPLFFLENI